MGELIHRRWSKPFGQLFDARWSGPPMTGVALKVEAGDWTRWPGLLDQWQTLVDQAAEPSFFLSTSWVDSWIRTFGPRLKPQILTFRDGATLVGLALVTRCAVHYGPLRVIQLCHHTAGEREADSTTLEYDDFLCAPTYRLAVVEAFADFWRSESWDELKFSGLERATCDLIYAGFDRKLCRLWTSNGYFVDLHRLRTQQIAYEDTLSSNARRQIRRSLRLYEKMGPVCLDSAASTEEALSMLEQLARLHQETWARRKIEGRFASAAFFDFHRQLVRTGFDKGEIQLLRVRAGDQAIGMLYNFVFRKRVYFYQSGMSYLSHDNRFKPGLVSHYLAIQHNLALGNDEYDFMAGEARYKKSLARNQRQLTWITYQNPTPITQVMRLARHTKRWLAKQRESWGVRDTRGRP